MTRIRIALSVLAGVAALLLTGTPAAAQQAAQQVARQALVTATISGNQVQYFCMGSGGSLARCTPESSRFTLTYEARNAYVISTAAGTCLDGARGQGQRVVLAPCNGSPAQDWYIVGNRIQNKANDLCLDVSESRYILGTPVILWGCSSSAANQQFVFGAVKREAEARGQIANLQVLNISARNVPTYLQEGRFVLRPHQVIAAGGGNVIAAGGGNLIGNATGNLIGQAGSNIRSPRYQILPEGPEPVAVLARPHLLPAGERFTCALSEDGTALCWGRNLYGQLGDGTTNPSAAPVQVRGDLEFASISAGYSHLCGLTEDGSAYCWGWGNSGQLGDGTQSHRREPTSVAGGIKFRSISAGYLHTCGVAEDGTAHCWGFNDSGQLGDGAPGDRFTTVFHTTPRPVETDLRFASIHAGRITTCGVTTGGQAHCWGNNNSGQLGDGTMTDSSIPVAVAGDLSFRSVGVGASFACGLTTDGKAYCWGRNQGRLGDGTHMSRNTPAPVVGGLTFVSLSVASDHSCGLTASGEAYCWGDAGFGRLGNGTTTVRVEPTAVAGGLTFRSLDAGEDHTCGVTVDGTGYCWGANWEYALGDGTTTNRLVPTGVVGWQASSGPGAGGGAGGAPASPAFAQVGDCRDPWVSQAVREVAGRRAIGSGDSGECMPALYGRGSWNGYEDLKLKVIAYFDSTRGNTTDVRTGQWTGSCSDVRITRAVLQANDQLRGSMQVRGDGEMGECDPRLYGRWSSEAGLQSHARQALGNLDAAGLEYRNGGRELYDRRFIERIIPSPTFYIGAREGAPAKNWYIALTGEDVLAIQRKCPPGSGAMPPGCLVRGS